MLKIAHDYFILCKPRVVLLMLVTAWVGMWLASPFVYDWQAWGAGTVGIALCSGGAAVLNHLIEYRLDQNMQRTQNRPVARGRITPFSAFLFALVLGGGGLYLLEYFVNILTAWLTLGALLGYAVFYTVFLKRATPQNIVIGGIAGAAPPLLGWTAITGHLDPYPLLLVGVVFVWTPPHFWALCVNRKADYQKNPLPMLPITHGIPFAKKMIVLYSILLCAMTLLPYVAHFTSVYYVGFTVLLNAWFLFLAIALLKTTEDSLLERQLSIRLFRYSILYLFLLFASLIVDKVLFIGANS